MPIWNDEKHELKDAVLADMKKDYYIVPRGPLHVWGAVIVVALVIAGIASAANFRSSIEAIAKEAATTSAKSVATAEAEIVAKDRASEVVRNVFQGAIDSARSAASTAVQSAAAEQVPREAKKAADEAIREWVKNSTHRDIFASLHEQDLEATRIVGKLHAMQKNAEASTIEGTLSSIEDAMQKEIVQIDALAKRWRQPSVCGKGVSGDVIIPPAGTTTADWGFMAIANNLGSSTPGIALQRTRNDWSELSDHSGWKVIAQSESQGKEPEGHGFTYFLVRH